MSATNTTLTPVPSFSAPTTAYEWLAVNTAETIARLSLARRNALLIELAAIEAEHDYGSAEKPSTKQLREWWREHRGVCPECGKRVL